MNKNIKIIFLGTNQIFENPKYFLKIFVDNSFLENLNTKREGNIKFIKKMKKEFALIKIMDINSFSEGKNDIHLTEADSLVIFFDLCEEKSLDNLKEMLDYMKNYCNWNNSTQKKIYILGKYNEKAEKFLYFTEKAITDTLSEITSIHDYIDFHTKELSHIIKTIDFIILDIFETRLRNDKLFKKNISNEKEKFASFKNCLIF